jgi:hypothetical protein
MIIVFSSYPVSKHYHGVYFANGPDFFDTHDAVA